MFWTISVTALIVFAYVILQKLLRPWEEKRLAKKIEAQKSKPGDYKFEIASDERGFAVISLKDKTSPKLSLNWEEIQKITAFKRDLWSVDQICLFIARADETGIELNEEMKGWSGFIQALPQFLPSCKPFENWFQTVAFPAFAANPTELYNRAADAKEISK